MAYDRTDEQRMLVDLIGTVARQGASGWGDVVVANGLDLLGVPTDEGGAGGDPRDAAVVAEALGRGGAGLPFAEHWTATRLGARTEGEPRATSAAAVLALARGEGEQGWAEDAMAVLHCAEIVGLCDAMLRDAALFAKERRQFGAAIAQFQVLRHRMSDMAMMLEQARAATDLAIEALDHEDEPTRRRAASAARVLADDAARIVGEGAVQIHGAMGLTAELRLGDLFRRARVLMQGDGGARAHLRRYAA